VLLAGKRRVTAHVKPCLGLVRGRLALFLLVGVGNGSPVSFDLPEPDVCGDRVAEVRVQFGEPPFDHQSSSC